MRASFIVRLTGAVSASSTNGRRRHLVRRGVAAFEVRVRGLQVFTCVDCVLSEADGKRARDGGLEIGESVSERLLCYKKDWIRLVSLGMESYSKRFQCSYMSDDIRTHQKATRNSYGGTPSRGYNCTERRHAQ